MLDNQGVMIFVPEKSMYSLTQAKQLSQQSVKMNMKSKMTDFFWSDITVQKFMIKSEGKIIKRFLGKVLIPSFKTDLSVSNRKGISPA